MSANWGHEPNEWQMKSRSGRSEWLQTVITTHLSLQEALELGLFMENQVVGWHEWVTAEGRAVTWTSFRPLWSANHLHLPWEDEDMGVKEACLLLLYVLTLSCLVSILTTLCYHRLYKHDLFVTSALFIGAFFFVAALFSMCFFPFFRSLLFSEWPNPTLASWLYANPLATLLPTYKVQNTEWYLWMSRNNGDVCCISKSPDLETHESNNSTATSLARTELWLQQMAGLGFEKINEEDWKDGNKLANQNVVQARVPLATYNLPCISGNCLVIYTGYRLNQLLQICWVTFHCFSRYKYKYFQSICYLLHWRVLLSQQILRWFRDMKSQHKYLRYSIAFKKLPISLSGMRLNNVH